MKESNGPAVLYDLDAERALIGSVLLDGLAFSECDGLITPESFYLGKNGTVWRTCAALLAENKPVDAIVVRDRLQADGSGIDPEHLLEAVNSVPTSANARFYADIVAEKAYRRALRRIGMEASRKAEDPGIGVSEIERGMTEAISSTVGDRSKPAKEFTALLSEAFARLMKPEDSISDAIPTPWVGMNSALNGGFRPGQLVYIAAPPSMGKTSFALQLAASVAVDQRKPTLIVSLETSGEILAQMILTSRSGLRVRSNRGLLGDEKERLVQAATELSGAPLSIIDDGNLSAPQIRSAARRMNLKEKLALVMVDFVQLIDPGSQRENRNAEMTFVSGQMKSMARELGCPVLACAQINREATKRENKRPMLSDLRDSGSLEQDADVVIFLHRQSYYMTPKGEQDPDDNSAEVIIAKNKLGRRNVTLDFLFDAPLFRFAPLKFVPEETREDVGRADLA